MTYRTLLIIASLMLAACTGEPGGGTAAEQSAGTNSESVSDTRSDGVSGAEPGGEQNEPAPSWRDERRALGEETYRAACASCHDAGEGGAPVTGSRVEWSGRSDMWQAVLFDHAKAGYLDMPGKGGQGGLSDEAVEAATEYMLEQTFPELPKD
jgi:cytochrome c5